MVARSEAKKQFISRSRLSQPAELLHVLFRYARIDDPNQDADIQSQEAPR